MFTDQIIKAFCCFVFIIVGKLIRRKFLRMHKLS